MKTMMAALALALAVPALAQDAVKEEYAAKLRGMRISIDFKSAPLEDVVSYLREISGMNMFVSAKVKEKGEIAITLKVSDIPLKSVLSLMLKPQGLICRYKEGVLLITTIEDGNADVVLEIYDVRDLLHPIQDFPGVEMTLAQDALGGAGVVEDAASKDEIPIVDLVKAHTGGKTWDDNPRATINLQNGLLVVKQTREVHAEVRRMISKLRDFK